MSARLLLCAAALLAGCASAPLPPGTVVPPEKIAAAIVPGQTTREQMLTALGPTTSVRFDSGYQAWLYQIPADGGRYAEFVVLTDPAGVVRKTRQRAPALPAR